MADERDGIGFGARLRPLKELLTADLALVLADLDLPHDAFAPDNPAHNRLCPVEDLERAAGELGVDGLLLAVAEGAPSDARLVALREQVWPACHLVGLFEVRDTSLLRITISGTTRLGSMGGPDRTLLVLRTREFVLSPRVTREKFETNAAAWNGEVGAPGYAHFRWMRRLVGTFAPVADEMRVLDFGSGAGWVGIEAAGAAQDVDLCAFDPSPEMIRIATANAAAQGVARFDGRVGFGEQPPFPRDGEPAFDLVISSGVLSFSPDLKSWIEGLTQAVRPGGTLVLGDLNPASWGMRRRRRTHALLPVRELNAHTSTEIREHLEAAGFRHEATAGYQLTRPVPQAMFVSETRLKGALSPLLLLANRACASLERALGDPLPRLFDSWVSRYVSPRG